MLNTRLAASALATIMLTASGCGESAKSSSHSALAGSSQLEAQTKRPLNRAQLIAQADAICERVNTERDSMTIRTRADYARILPQIATYEQTALAEMIKFSPPKSMEEDWKQILNEIRTIAESTAKAGESFQSHHINPPTSLLTSAAAAGQRLSLVAHRDGFKACAQTQ